MRRLATVAVLSALVAAAASLASAAPGRAVAATGKQPTAVGTGGAAASMDLNASQAAITVPKQGGNAVDAAVAAASTRGVTIPFVAGPGGGGFMVIYLARTHQVVTIDGRENCPAACTPGMFLDHKTGQPLDYFSPRTSRWPPGSRPWWPPGRKPSASTGG
jgi:gamma-glutamyltranspeptidase / glutathione hydrolase